MFIDRAKIRVRGGGGGNGVTAFRREKFVPRGGPSGGDGGRGGDVWIVADASLNTLLHLRYNPEHVAGRGMHGEGSNRAGRGGRGGFGNAHFATSTNRAPRYHQDGSPGEYFELQLELKLLADVGLVGFPNAGKSTFISRISAARPKIADYPFTTLEPYLGVVDMGDFRTFVVADIPGLIEGAHEGHGLGDRFLRHLERTKLLLHLVDVSSASGRDAVSDYEVINRELSAYGARLDAQPQIVVATKLDALDEPERVERLRECATKDGRLFFAISSVTGDGMPELLAAIVRELDRIRTDSSKVQLRGVNEELLIGSL